MLKNLVRELIDMCVETTSRKERRACGSSCCSNEEGLAGISRTLATV